MIIRYFGTSGDDFWCYGTRTEDLNKEVTSWHKNYVGRCMQTVGPEVFITWGKMEGLCKNVFHMKRSQYNTRSAHKVRAKAQEYQRPKDCNFEQNFLREKIEEAIAFKTLQNSF